MPSTKTPLSCRNTYNCTLTRSTTQHTGYSHFSPFRSDLLCLSIHSFLYQDHHHFDDFEVSKPLIRIKWVYYKSIKCIEYRISDHLHPLIGSLGFEEVSLLFIGNWEDLTVKGYWGLLLESQFSLLLACFSAIVDQLWGRVKDEHSFFEIAEKGFLAHYSW